MAYAALQNVDVNATILLHFMNELTIIHPLYPGHKPTTAMIDIRTPK